MPARNAGLTLIELIASIVVLAVVMTVVVMMVGGQSRLSTDPMVRIRAANLARSLLQEITVKAFDEANLQLTNGQRLPCGSNGAPACRMPLNDCSNGLMSDAEEAGRNLYDDVDDYNCLDQQGDAIANSLGLVQPGLYGRYRVQVFVRYDGNFDGVADTNVAAKQIQVRVTLPDYAGSTATLDVTAYRANY